MQLFYIDAIPGSGKTEYFIERAIALLQNPDPDHVLVYAAPTHKLIEETYRRLVTKFGVSSERIQLISQMTGRPTLVLQRLFGRSTPLVDRVRMGSVVLVSQEALLRMDMGQVNFKLARLFFDETCKIVHGTAHLGAGFVLRPDTPLIDKAREKNYVLSRYMPQHKDQIKDTLAGALKTFHDSQSPFYKETYVVKHQGTTTVSLTAFAIWKPEMLFRAFEQVTVTASFFKDSQLYLYLTQNGTKLVNLLMQKNLSEALRKIRRRAELIINSTIERARVGVLLEEATTRVLTTKLLGEGVVFPTKSELGAYFKEHPLLLRQSVMGVLSAVRTARADMRESAIRASLDLHFETEEQRLIAPWSRPPLLVLIERSFAMIQQWSNFHGRKPQTLLIPNSPGLFNDLRQRYWLSHMPYANLVATASLFGPPEDGPINIELLRGPTKKLFLSMSMRDVAVLQEVRHKTEMRLLSVSESPVLHGLNTLTDHTVFVHLAALNPTPMQHIFFEFLIPGYDPESDYCADSIAQLLYRTNLRNPKSKEQVLVILPYEATVQLLETKLGLEIGKFKRIGKPTLTGTNLSHAIVRAGVRERAPYRGKWHGVPKEVRQKVKALRTSIIRFKERADLSAANGQMRSAERSIQKGNLKLAELRQMQRDMEIAYSRKLECVTEGLTDLKLRRFNKA